MTYLATDSFLRNNNQFQIWPIAERQRNILR